MEPEPKTELTTDLADSMDKTKHRSRHPACRGAIRPKSWPGALEQIPATKNFSQKHGVKKMKSIYFDFLDPIFLTFGFSSRRVGALRSGTLNDSLNHLVCADARQIGHSEVGLVQLQFG